jgi:hypothetical protein
MLDEVGFPLRLVPLEHWPLVYGVPVPRSRRPCSSPEPIRQSLTETLGLPCYL